MAYMFNKFLDVKFKKRSKNIDFKSPYASYSLFEYEDMSENVGLEFDIECIQN